MKRTILILTAILLTLTVTSQKYTVRHKDKKEKTVAPSHFDSLRLQKIPYNANGAIEYVEVVDVPGTTAAQLFNRAMETLSNWAGPNGRAKAGVDYSDKESGIIIYKGANQLQRTTRPWVAFCDFTLKIRCKDGRAQITSTVPSMYAVSQTLIQQKESHPVSDVRFVMDNPEKKPKERYNAAFYLLELNDIAESLKNYMRLNLQAPPSDDF